MFNNPFCAIAVGAVLGFSSLAPLQQGLNHLTVKHCTQDTHKIVSYTDFFGTVKACIDKRYS